MSTKFPLLDGRTVDLTNRPGGLDPGDPSPFIADFKEESNPSWLSLETDNGSQSFSGLASAGGRGTTTLTTGTTSTGDVTNLKTESFNWDNWSEVWCYAWGVTLPEPASSRIQVMLSDNKDLIDVSEAFRIHSLDQSDPSGVPYRIVSGGAANNSTLDQVTRSDPHMYGFRIYENADNPDSTGHQVDWYFDWQPIERMTEWSGNWPNSTELSFRVGIRTEDTAADRSLDIGGVFVGLVP